MTRRLLLGLVLAGVGATAAAVLLVVGGVTPTTPNADPGWVAWLVAIAGLLVGLGLLATGTSTDTERQSLPWSPTDAIAEGRPEATAGRQRLTGGELVGALQEAGAVARNERDVEAGVAHVRPLLCDLYDDLRTRDHGAADPAAALDEGTWTDDRVAASVLSPNVDPPPRPLGRRLRDWLYPGRAVTRRVRRTVGALGDLADETVPPVVGQSAPRQIPVHEPSLAARTVRPGGEHPAPAPRTELARPAGNRPAGGADGADDGAVSGEGVPATEAAADSRGDETGEGATDT